MVSFIRESINSQVSKNPTHTYALIRSRRVAYPGSLGVGFKKIWVPGFCHRCRVTLRPCDLHLLDRAEFPCRSAGFPGERLEAICFDNHADWGRPALFEVGVTADRSLIHEACSRLHGDS